MTHTSAEAETQRDRETEVQGEPGWGNARGFNLVGCEVIQRRERRKRRRKREREREREREKGGGCQGEPGWGKCKRI